MAESSESLYIAVDLGAGSGRVMLGGVGEGELLLEEIRRFHYPVEKRDGNLRWDLGHILREIKAGARQAGLRARALGRPIRSLGVDSWGVDYGLVDRDGRLLEDPVCYRDERTTGGMERVFARVPREEIFARTGIQFLVFNTLYQLDAHAVPPAARRLLLIPDLLHFQLTGRAVAEYTNATTTQFLSATKRDWDRDLLQKLELPAQLLPEVVPAGADLGPLRPELAAELGLEGVRVVAPATHDTASAVAGAPLDDGWAYISSGTWSLVGVERHEPLVNAEVARENFTNEGGACGTVRFLKNVMGLWLLENCRREWKEGGLDVEHGKLLGAVARADVSGAVWVDDPRFFNPKSMIEALGVQLAETGQPVPSEPVALTKIILDSLAFRYASVVRTIERLTGKRPAGVHVVGGGSQNDYLNQATADATGLPVLAGPVEATATGNLLVQAIAAGRFPSLAAARAHVRKHVQLRRFEPRPSPAFDAAARKYAELER